MQKLKAIIQLIRLPNLVFIVLAQILAYYNLIIPSLRNESSPTLSQTHLLLVVCSTLLIAAAGYIINDYFDIGIDAINKPQRVTIEKIFKRRTIIIWHIILNLAAIIIVGFIAYYELQLRLIGVQLFCIFLLLVYSTTFKRKLISGNFIIATLTSLSLISIALYEPKFHFFNIQFPYAKLFWWYVAFAFLITFIREIIKDIEDVKGDIVQGCKTIPLVWGISIAKKIIYMFMILLFIALIIMFSLYGISNSRLVLFLIPTVFLPLFYLTFLIRKANTSQQFHQISTILKWVTFLGILSMILI